MLKVIIDKILRLHNYCTQNILIAYHRYNEYKNLGTMDIRINNVNQLPCHFMIGH